MEAPAAKVINNTEFDVPHSLNLSFFPRWDCIRHAVPHVAHMPILLYSTVGRFVIFFLKGFASHACVLDSRQPDAD